MRWRIKIIVTAQRWQQLSWHFHNRRPIKFARWQHHIMLRGTRLALPGTMSWEWVLTSFGDLIVRSHCARCLFSVGTASVYSLGCAQVRPPSVRARCTLHRRLLRLWTVSHPRRRRGARAGARLRTARRRQTRAVGRWTEDAHKAVGQSQVYQVHPTVISFCSLGFLAMHGRYRRFKTSSAKLFRSAQFLPCDAMHSAAIAVTRCLSVRPSVRPSVCQSRSWVAPKRIKISSKFFHHVPSHSSYYVPNGVVLLQRELP